MYYESQISAIFEVLQLAYSGGIFVRDFSMIKDIPVPGNMNVR